MPPGIRLGSVRAMHGDLSFVAFKLTLACWHGAAVVIRLVVSCGLWHYSVRASLNAFGVELVLLPRAYMNIRAPIWQRIKEYELDMTATDLYPVEQGGYALKRRYLLVAKN